MDRPEVEREDRVLVVAGVVMTPAVARQDRQVGVPAEGVMQLLEHMRIAHEDILDFCVNATYEHTMKWPHDYWPAEPAPPDARAWNDSIASHTRSRDEFKRLARELEDLTAIVPTGKGSQTYLRAILLAIDHDSYHVGQLVALRRALGIWTA